MRLQTNRVLPTPLPDTALLLGRPDADFTGHSTRALFDHVFRYSNLLVSRENSRLQSLNLLETYANLNPQRISVVNLENVAEGLR